MQTLRHLIFIACLLALLIAARSTAAADPLDLQAAIDAAEAGSVLSIAPGHYAGRLVIDKPLHLVGEQGPNGERVVIDGERQGSVLTILADGTVVENVVIRNSGNVIDQEDAGIVVEKANDVQLIGNRLEDVLYGIKGVEATRLTLRDNHIVGRTHDIARRGDGIRLWQSEDSLVEGNTVEKTRDVIFWFSDGTTVRNNRFESNRYGVHMMYTDGMTVVGNVMSHNSVGAYLMYSVDVLLEGNTMHNNRGPSGYGIALKDMDAVRIRDNYLLDNRVGLFFDNSPARVNIEQQIERNVFAYNDTGVLMMPAVKRNVLRGNTFLDNLEQVGVKGGSSQQGDQLGGNRWDGNFWSDYAGYDQERSSTALASAGLDGFNMNSAVMEDAAAGSTGDGIGDLPYRAESLFENLSDRHPNLKLFHFSPVEGAIDLAAQAFPVIKPKPKLTDAAPLMAPVLPSFPAQLPVEESPIGVLALGMLAAAGALFWSQIQPHLSRLWSWLWSWQQSHLHPADQQSARESAAPSQIDRISSPDSSADETAQAGMAQTTIDNQEPSMSGQSMNGLSMNEQSMITVKNLTKRYPQPGRPWWSDATVTAVDDLSFELGQGQALALWGSNGAGKTTVLKCLLGLLACEGDLHLAGVDLRRQGRQARRLLGYVPQELAFHADMSVQESCRFYARLKGVSTQRIPVVLDQVGLSGQLHKRVGALSGGMKQRLALALALLADPPVLLLDEPTSNLDAQTRGEFIDLLSEQRRAGKSLLFTSHHVEEVEQLADQVLILRDGKLAAQGTPLALMAQILPERSRPVRHIKVVVDATQQSTAQAVLAAAGYATAPNGHGLWVTVPPERKAEPLTLLHTASIDVLDVEM